MKIELNKYYKVKKYDTVNNICKKFNLDKDELIKINYIRNEKIEQGDILILKSSKINSHIYHIVMPKETIQSIANKYDIPIKELIIKNNIKNVFIGQKLLIK